MAPDHPVEDTAPRLVTVLKIAVPAWAATVVYLLCTAGPLVAHNLGDPDDSLRLQQVRDLLFGGQGWYDLVQHRFNPPDGVFIHWSRLIDLPIAGLILLFKPLTGIGTAELWARALWPTIPILPLVAAIGVIAGRLGGLRAAVVAMLFGCAACTVIGLLRPGRIDHHNVQLAATMVLFACLMVETNAAAVTAGVVCALMLAIGMETMPYTALACALVTVRWALLGRGTAFLRWFFVSFAVAAALGFVATVAPSLWRVPVCDMISPLYLVPLAAGAAAFAGFAPAAARVRGRRFGLAGAVATIVIGSVAWLNPACLGGPFAAVDPMLFKVWMNNVDEARGALDVFRVDPAVTLAVFALPAAAMLIGTAYLLTGRRIVGMGGLLALVGLSFLVSLWQVRAVSFDSLFAIPVIAVVLVRVSAMPGSPQRSALTLATACLFVNPLSLPLYGLAAGGAMAATRTPLASDSFDHCLEPHDYDALAALPPGRVAAPVEIGSFIVATTPHSALAAPYHRNRTGILDVYALLTGPDGEAQQIAARRGVDYVAYCSQSSTSTQWVTGGADALEARLERGEVPSWLRRVPASGLLRIFEVVR